MRHLLTEVSHTRAATDASHCHAAPVPAAAAPFVCYLIQPSLNLLCASLLCRVRLLWLFCRARLPPPLPLLLLLSLPPSPPPLPLFRLPRLLC